MSQVLAPAPASVPDTLTTTSRQVAKIALIGNPNSGKSSLFNHLTGLNQKVGNFPGVTVDKKTGISQLTPGLKAQVIDLPGTYSLYPKSLDEKVIIDLLHDKKSASYPDVLVITADASNLKRNLLLFTQLADLKIPAVLALNMMDVAEKHGVKIDLAELQKELGVPVIPVNARTGSGLAALKILLSQELEAPKTTFFPIPEDLLVMVRQIRYYFELSNDYLAWHYAHQYQKLSFLSEDDKEYIGELVKKYDFRSNTLQANETIERYTRINGLLLDAMRVTKAENNEQFSNKLDQILTHKIFGYLIFFLILFMIFQAIFAWAAYPMDLIDTGIATLNAWIHSQADGPLVDLLTEGVLAGLGGGC
nr:FeoB small GTPase domain-containing protein [Rufibacter tibetensis]